MLFSRFTHYGGVYIIALILGLCTAEAVGFAQHSIHASPLGEAQAITATAVDSISDCDFSILSWNIYMLPGYTFMNIGQKKRADRIARVLLESHKKHDVIVFSEAFHKAARRRIWRQLKDIFPYQAGPLNKGGFLKTNGGVWILSRTPLHFLGQIKFEDCAGADCWARKGALLVETEKNGHRYQIVGTHLQADEDERRDSIRVRQYRAIRDELLVRYQTAGVVQLVCGDMNTLPESTTYAPMQQLLGANDGHLTGNMQVSWPTLDFCKANQKPCFLYDYILIKPNGQHIAKSERQLHAFRRAWKQHKNMVKHDLSDHYGIEMQLWW